ncbi:DUF945 domain-containing protein [Candidatus Pacearchaeota archaeon]|jgi:DNA-directed RNA polymerase subunit N (RpoN/RPB10)|nr:DUF945 domain-containing protein [Candidatus Pacearchaeota archaeon]
MPNYPVAESKIRLVDGKTIQGYKATFNPEDGFAYGIVRNRYKVVSHQGAIDIVSEAIKLNPEFGEGDLKTIFTDDGRKMKATFTFSEIDHNIGDKGDILHPTVTLFNSYDASWPLSLLFGAFRVVCSNGMIVGEKFMQFKRKHTLMLDPKSVIDHLSEGMEKFSMQTNLWQEWVERTLAASETERMLNELHFGKKETKALEQEIEVSSNLTLDAMRKQAASKWLLYALVTQFVTHKIKSETRRVDLEKRIAKVFY